VKPVRPLPVSDKWAKVWGGVMSWRRVWVLCVLASALTWCASASATKRRAASRTNRLVAITWEGGVGGDMGGKSDH
jgi:hypothetical protein